MTFLDTNVLIYSIDGKDPAKQVVAREIVVSAVRPLSQWGLPVVGLCL